MTRKLRAKYFLHNCDRMSSASGAVVDVDDSKESQPDIFELAKKAAPTALAFERVLEDSFVIRCYYAVDESKVLISDVLLKTKFLDKDAVHNRAGKQLPRHKACVTQSKDGKCPYYGGYTYAHNYLLVFALFVALLVVCVTFKGLVFVLCGFSGF